MTVFIASLFLPKTGKLGDYTYVGTLGMPTDALEGSQQKQDIEDKLATEHDALAVWCSDKDFNGHYSHFCKQILWPVFHYQIPDNPKSKAYEDHSWKYYVNVNQAFADKIVRNWKRGDVIWVHDYHLLLVPGMVRKKLPDAKIGFFLHVAFPSSEIFRCLAMRKELLEGMLGANLIGFQIHEYTRHFLQTCSRILAAEATPDGLQLEDRFVDVINLPIGIDPVALDQHRGEPEVARWIESMRQRYQDCRLIVARDKLDHVRGVRQKLLSYELFLNKNPEWRGKTVLIQVALSTSEKSELDATVSDIVTRVNSSWANLAYQPVVYLKQDIDYAQYLALLTIADALMITSQREGMNLTSHEFLACQDGRHTEAASGGEVKKHGSLILSEFTGTASLFGGHELSVNPWDYQACSDAIKQALTMGEDEKARRWGKLYEAVNHHTGAHWFTEFLSRLDRVYEEQHKRDQTAVPRLSMSSLARQYKRSERRLFILDYEGTLVSWGPVNQIIPVSPQVLAPALPSSTDPLNTTHTSFSVAHRPRVEVEERDPRPSQQQSSQQQSRGQEQQQQQQQIPEHGKVSAQVESSTGLSPHSPLYEVSAASAALRDATNPSPPPPPVIKTLAQAWEEQKAASKSSKTTGTHCGSTSVRTWKTNLEVYGLDDPRTYTDLRQQRTLDVLSDLLLDERNTIYVMSGRRPEELDRLFRRIPNLGLIAENGCFLKDCGSDSWIEMADGEQIRSWKESVKGIMTYYLERTPGAEVEERRCSLMFHYKSAEDYDTASRLASDCASHINDACEAQRVHAVPLDGCVIVEPVDWTKSTAAEHVFDGIRKRIMGSASAEGQEQQQHNKDAVDFLMVVGDGREDEKVFRWANQLGEDKVVRDVVTVSLGSRNTEAGATLTQGVSGVLLALQKLSAVS
ncbi:hypothetical protein MAPG_03473 [Magnaporthiopsis poae ATCC 64411]|uniref:Uncharacterized protein n=1 Tax=Magnaporthiopsis poae (strain ATCC 64411 / 73-15) TaxID=644358 RepID=A0A0C4DU39_MAGP6|nr:hypothetical protein MAPG_03473 [Magnaporthiopsis poae ATCC 64411]